MNIRSKVKIWSSFLLIILLVTGMLGACESPASETTPGSDTTSTSDNSDTSLTTDDPDTSLAPADKVEVVYFHRENRCSGCMYAEDTTRYTLETYFADELASGKITFASFSVEDEENAAIVEKYGAYSSSLFINSIIDGADHIEQVTEIWSVLFDDEAFIEVVKSEIEQSLSGEG